MREHRPVKIIMQNEWATIFFVLAANHQVYSGNIQRLFEQSTAATSSSNQQQQPAAAINSSNNQLLTYQHHLHDPRRPTLDTITVPSTGYVLLEVDLGLAARLRVQSPLPRTIFVTFRFF